MTLLVKGDTMNKVMEKANYSSNNLLTFRGKMSSEKVQSTMGEMISFIRNSNLKKVGPVITATHAMVSNEMDLEIMIPVNTQDIISDEYFLKSQFKLVNTIMLTHYGEPNKMQNTYNKLIEHISKNKLSQITCAYNVARVEVDNIQDIDKSEIDVYIGINPSIL